MTCKRCYNAPAIEHGICAECRTDLIRAAFGCVPAVRTGIDYREESIEKRAEGSPLWPVLENQQGRTLPYLLERYLLLKNYQLPHSDEVNFLHCLMADAVTVLLSQEERIRKLEARQ